MKSMSYDYPVCPVFYLQTRKWCMPVIEVAKTCVTCLQTAGKLSDGDPRQPSPRAGHDSNIPKPGRPDGLKPEGGLLQHRQRLDMDCDSMLLAVYGVIQGLGTDDRPEVSRF